MNQPWTSMPIALLCITACMASAPASPTPASVERVVAIGDLHGDLDNALDVLRLAGLIDEAARWSGGTTTLVQTGDTTDRGPDSRGVMDLMRRLQKEAPAAGGRVIPLLGNHEVMNLQGDLRYVHPGDPSAFGGSAARARAFSPDGEYGVWLASLDAVAKVDDTVFTHGGIHPTWAAKGLDAINAEVRDALYRPGSEATGATGPLWLRTLVTEPEPTACPLLEQSLAALGARRMVVGHTTRRGGAIESRCGGRLHVIDVGIADHYGANYAVWESTSGDARALTPSGVMDLEDPP